MVRYGTAAQARKRAHNVNTNFYSDSEINELLDRYSLNLHLELGRAVSGADFTSADIQYQTAISYVISSTAAEILASIEIDDADRQRSEDQAKKDLDTLRRGGTIPIASASFNITDGVDEDIYMEN